MRHSSFIVCVGSIGLFACNATPQAAEPSGVHGAVLGSTLAVHVVDEIAGTPVAGASVDVGGATVTTDSNGDATLSTSASSVTLRVSAAGFVTERWIGVDHDHATVALAAPLLPHTFAGSISAGGTDAVVSAATEISILRTSSFVGTTSPCAGGACDATFTVAARASDTLWVAIVDATSARFVAGVTSDGHFTIASSPTGDPIAHLRTLTATIPSGAGLEGVVGVPGLASAYGVTLFPSFTPMTTNVVAPSSEGPFSGDRLWYVARGTNADASGESVLLDRNIGADSVVHLPSAFLAIPSATASGSVGIDVDPEVDLYVIEAFAGDSSERALVLHPSGSHIDVPISLSGASSVVVRAVDAGSVGADVDLDAIERSATRIATLQL